MTEKAWELDEADGPGRPLVNESATTLFWDGRIEESWGRLWEGPPRAPATRCGDPEEARISALDGDARGDGSGRGGFLTGAAVVGFQLNVELLSQQTSETSPCTCVESDAPSAPPFKIFLLSNLNVHQQRSGLKRCGTYTMECYSAIKKEWKKAICSNMDGPREHHIEWSKSEREGEISYDIPYMWHLKRNYTNKLTYKTETHRLKEPSHGCQGSKREEGTVREFGTDMYTLLHLK